ncbi:MAG: thermonuclease family protein [Rhodobiaceae bacterium]|nr:thermonuclease family protein [Rhodobiaceae bacterium]MCC0041342.1 thermonuclease family protein [Rhodobiaceae bacterium]
MRLQGIAAPEDRRDKREPGGPESSASLRRLVTGRFVICHRDGTSTRGRPVGVCYQDGQDLGRFQVESGQAYSGLRSMKYYEVKQRRLLLEAKTVSLWAEPLRVPAYASCRFPR